MNDYELYEINVLGNAYGNLHILRYKDKYYMDVFCESAGFNWVNIKHTLVKSFFKKAFKKAFKVERDYVLEEDYHYKYKHLIKSLRKLDKVMNLKEKGDE